MKVVGRAFIKMEVNGVHIRRRHALAGGRIPYPGGLVL
jgi:hypothetical protein